MNTISILYFARIREALACEQEQFSMADLKSDSSSVAAIIEQLRARGGAWQAVFEDKFLVAINHEIAPMDATVKAGDELAFYPPVTGG